LRFHFTHIILFFLTISNLAVAQNRNLITYTLNDGLPSETINALAQDEKGYLYIGTENGLSEFDGVQFKNYNLSDGLKSNKVNVIFSDHKRKIWIGTEEGISVLENSNIQSIPLDINTKCLIGKNDSTLYVGTVKGLYQMDKKKLTLKKLKLDYPSEPFVINDLIYHNQDLILATKNGLFSFDGNRLFELNLNQSLKNKSINSIEFSTDGKYWLSIPDYGVVSLNSSLNLENIFPYPEIKTAHQACILGKEIWFATQDQGVAIYNTDLDSWKYINENEGLDQKHVSTIYPDNWDNFWIGTKSGLVKYQNQNPTSKSELPKIHLKKISIFYEDIFETEFANQITSLDSFASTISLPRDQNHLSFVYEGVHLQKKNKPKYQWKLEGSNSSWSPITDQSSVNFSNLKYGKYLFKVKAITEGQNESETLSVPFIIEKSIWEEWWFRITVGALSLLALIFLFRYRLKTAQKKSQQKNKELKLKNELLSLEQKALQLQMNPHFVFNALNSIQSLVALNKNDEARKQLHNFATMMRSLLNNSRQENISLAEEIKALEEYIKMEQFCQRKPFDYTIDLAKIEDPEDVMIPTMLIQPFVENAIIHGFNNLDRPAMLELQFSATNNLLTCIVKDNGIGRKKSEEMKVNKQAGHQSVALKVNTERLKKLRGKRDYDCLEFKDALYNGRIEGTQVTIKFPYKSSF